jgi:hypothetical protein
MVLFDWSNYLMKQKTSYFLPSFKNEEKLIESFEKELDYEVDNLEKLFKNLAYIEKPVIFKPLKILKCESNKTKFDIDTKCLKKIKKRSFENKKKKFKEYDLKEIKITSQVFNDINL